MVSGTDAVAPRGVGAPERGESWFAQDAEWVVAAMQSDVEAGLSGDEAASRLSRYGPNQIAGEKPPSVWVVALAQLRDPMNIMLVAVVVVSLLIGQVSTAVIVGLLVVLNVVLGARQELKARASVDALAKLCRSGARPSWVRVWALRLRLWLILGLSGRLASAMR